MGAVETLYAAALHFGITTVIDGRGTTEKLLSCGKAILPQLVQLSNTLQNWVEKISTDESDFQARLWIP